MTVPIIIFIASVDAIIYNVVILEGNVQFLHTKTIKFIINVTLLALLAELYMHKFAHLIAIL